MMLTTLLFGFVQIPALMIPSDAEVEKIAHSTHQSVFDVKASYVNKPSLYGVIACAVSFFAYLYLQTLPDTDEDAANTEKKIAALRMDAIRSGALTLRGAMGSLYKEKATTTNGATEPLVFGGSVQEKQGLQDVLK